MTDLAWSFDQPWLASIRYSMRVAIWITGPVFASTIIRVTFALTHDRVVEIGVRAPERAIALRETIGLLIYGAMALISDLFLAGSLVGTASDSILPGACFD